LLRWALRECSERDTKHGAQQPDEGRDMDDEAQTPGAAAADRQAAPGDTILLVLWASKMVALALALEMLPVAYAVAGRLTGLMGVAVALLSGEPQPVATSGSQAGWVTEVIPATGTMLACTVLVGTALRIVWQMAPPPYASPDD
jgi:hypothetical protein